MIDALRYDIYSRGDHSIILRDKIEHTFAIHSKDEANDVATITGFRTAAEAMQFANERVVALEKDSRAKG